MKFGPSGGFQTRTLENVQGRMGSGLFPFTYDGKPLLVINSPPRAAVTFPVVLLHKDSCRHSPGPGRSRETSRATSRSHVQLGSSGKCPDVAACLRGADVGRDSNALRAVIVERWPQEDEWIISEPRMRKMPTSPRPDQLLGSDQ